MRIKLLKWGKTPITVPRWMLTLKYFFFAVLGGLSLASGGVESINVTTFEGFTSFWSGMLVIASTAAMVASFDEKWEQHWEKWASFTVAALLFTWSVAAGIRGIAEGDIGRLTSAVSIFIISMLPGARALSLLRKSRYDS